MATTCVGQAQSATFAAKEFVLAHGVKYFGGLTQIALVPDRVSRLGYRRAHRVRGGARTFGVEADGCIVRKGACGHRRSARFLEPAKRRCRTDFGLL